jgi:uncharacterized protein YjbK
MRNSAGGAEAEEREIKLKIPTPELYKKLVADLPGPEGVVHQRNHYFDTGDGCLVRRGLMLRVRDEDGEIIVTLKGPAKRHGFASVRTEVEEGLQRDLWEQILHGQGALEHLDAAPLRMLEPILGGRTLKLLGWIDNERRIHRLSSGPLDLTVELDRTRFPDGSEEYELEVEVDRHRQEAAETYLRDILSELGLSWELQSKGKYQRFREKLGNR